MSDAAPLHGRRAAQAADSSVPVTASWTDGPSDGAASPASRRTAVPPDDGADGVAGSRQRSKKWAEHESAVIAADESAVAVVRDGDDARDASDKLAATVADAPRNAGGRSVATLAELNSEQRSSAGALNVTASRNAGVDLTLLTSTLFAPDALAEADEAWDEQVLLERIAQDVRAEREAEERVAAEDGTAPPLTSARAAGDNNSGKK